MMAECDIPTPGPARRPDTDLPHPALSTGAGVPVTVIDTGSAVAGVTGDNSSCFLHGTAVASVVRQIAPNARIHAVRHTDREDQVEGTVESLVEAIDRAIEATLDADTDADAHTHHDTAPDAMTGVINISMITCEDVPELADAVKRAHAEGILVTASAGNSGQCEDDEMPYPAAYDSVLAVGAVEHRVPLGGQSVPGSGELDSGRIPADYSSPGPWVDLYAPGGPVSAQWHNGDRTTTIIGGPDPFIGTSFAAPVVSGAAALVAQVLPTATVAQVRDILQATAKPGGASEDGAAPLLVVDPAAAVDATLSLQRSSQQGQQSPQAQPGAGQGIAANRVPAHLDSQAVVTPTMDYSVPVALSFVVAVAIVCALVARALR